MTATLTNEATGEILAGEIIRPWNEWPTPRILTAGMDDLNVVASNGGLVLRNGQEEVARTSFRGLQQMSHKVGFDAKFIGQLTLPTQALVINERLRSVARADRKEVALVCNGDEFTNFLPSVREVLTYQETADVAFDTMTGVYGDLTIDHARLIDGAMSLRLMTDVEQPVTRAVGDALQMGVEVRQDYGASWEVDLYIKRLSCLNGMSSWGQEFSWRNREQGTRDHQRLWLAEGIAEALGAYEEMVSRSRLMASTRFEGDPEAALRERARSMGLPRRHHAALFAAFAEEPGDTEWDLLNAFTRVGTHAGLPNGLGRRVQEAAGDWSREFDLVTARLPRPIANRVGATIIEQIENLIPTE